jgi:hypothetical protein
MAKLTIYDFIVADRNMVANGKGYSFRNYTDKAGVFENPGAVVMYNDGSKDKQGRPVGKAFSVGQSHYKLQAREGQKDYDGMSLYDYFSNAPFCLGSPNGDYVDPDGNPVPIEDVGKIEQNLKRVKTGEIRQLNVKIKLLNDEMDAQFALEAGLKRAEAQISSGQIDEETLIQIAALIGEFNQPEKTLRLKVYEFAGRLPLDYFKHLNAGDRAVRALVRKGIADGVLKTKGTVILYGETILGNDENAAVATLLGDQAMMNGLSDAVKFKIDKKKKK